MQGIVTIGDLEIFLTGDLTDFEMERAAGESIRIFRKPGRCTVCYFGLLGFFLTPQNSSISPFYRDWRIC
jgi:hypothetical protein